MITTILLLLLALIFHGGLFVWAMCRSARLGDEAMENALRQAHEMERQARL